jgi:hypothetical protein
MGEVRVKQESAIIGPADSTRELDQCQLELNASFECGAFSPLWQKRRQVGALQRRGPAI